MSSVMVRNKIGSVSDKVCLECGQCYEGECRVFQMPHSKAEEEYRVGKRPLCQEARKRLGEAVLAALRSIREGGE